MQNRVTHVKDLFSLSQKQREASESFKMYDCVSLYDMYISACICVFVWMSNIIKFY